eukprot:Tbor_TRINITY_DN3824_c0_g1::TRINITY_DN3824_c0_g1_i1::g.5673::m.5673
MYLLHSNQGDTIVGQSLKFIIFLHNSKVSEWKCVPSRSDAILATSTRGVGPQANNNIFSGLLSKPCIAAMCVASASTSGLPLYIEKPSGGSGKASAAPILVRKTFNISQTSPDC